MITTWMQQFAAGGGGGLIWILALAFWNDGGEWIDTDVWND
jgi:hypothetical protein